MIELTLIDTLFNQRKKKKEWLIKYCWNRIEGRHRCLAVTKDQALINFKRYYGSGFDYITVERW